MKVIRSFRALVKRPRPAPRYPMRGVVPAIHLDWNRERAQRVGDP